MLRQNLINLDFFYLFSNNIPFGGFTDECQSILLRHVYQTLFYTKLNIYVMFEQNRDKA